MILKQQRFAVWFLSIIFALLCVWRAFNFPYRRDALLLAIPPEAVWFAEHERLADGWRDIASNPLVKGALAANGLDDESYQKIFKSRGLEKMMRSLADKNTVLAYVPADKYGDPGKPALIAASWVGSRAPFLRWRSLGKAMGRSAVKRHLKPGVDIWTKTLSEYDGHLYFLSACVVRGALYACVSRDPFGVQYVVSRVNNGGNLDSVREALDLNSGGGKSAHRGCFKNAVLLTGSDVVNSSVSYELSVKGPLFASAQFRMPDCARTIAPIQMPETSWDSIANLLQDGPAALLAIEKERFAGLMASILKCESSVFEQLLKASQDTAPAFICLLASQDESRLMGIKSPAFICGIATGMKPEDLYGSVSETLDRLNASKNFGLIPFRVKSETAEWIRVGATDSGILASLREGETPALAVSNGWLLIATGENILRLALNGKLSGAESDGWKSFLKQTSHVPALWMDAGPAFRSLRDGVAVMTLFTMAKSDQNAIQEQRRRLDKAKTFLQHAQDAEICSIRIEPENSFNILRFEMKKR